VSFILFMQVGVIHGINKFNAYLPHVNLTVSLHAPDQDIRCQIMPAARAFSLEKILKALQSYQNER
jgi:adenine C2-methylase RlmN of 23S rRNA A2503 and tRNA A37